MAASRTAASPTFLCVLVHFIQSSHGICFSAIQVVGRVLGYRELTKQMLRTCYVPAVSLGDGTMVVNKKILALLGQIFQNPKIVHS